VTGPEESREERIRRHEQAVRDEVSKVAQGWSEEVLRDAGLMAVYSVELRGRFPDTALVVRTQYLDSPDPHEEPYAVWEPRDRRRPDVSNDPDDYVFAGSTVVGIVSELRRDT
jgi:hypothetical protein